MRISDCSSDLCSAECPLHRGCSLDFGGHANDLPFGDPVVRRSARAIDAELPRPCPPRNDVEADIRQMPLEPTIQPDTVIVRLDPELPHILNHAALSRGERLFRLLRGRFRCSLARCSSFWRASCPCRRLRSRGSGLVTWFSDAFWSWSSRPPHKIGRALCREKKL